MAYTTGALVKNYRGITGTGDDILLDSCAARAQAIIDAYTGRTFEASTNTTRTFDAIRDVHRRTLRFDVDCASIDTVTNGDTAVIAAANYVTSPRNAAPYYAITLLASKGLYWTYSTDPENAISVSAKWAYSTTAPAVIVQATLRLAAYLYSQRDTNIFETTASPELGIITVPQALPRDVLAELAFYRRRM